MTRRLSFLTVSLLIAASSASTQASAADGFIPLFNGKNLSGWTIIGNKSSFDVKNGMIRTTGARPYPTSLRSLKKYENFILRFSFRAEKWYEGGVRLHVPAHKLAAKMGFRIHLRHKPENMGDHSMGAIYNIATPRAFPGKHAKKWNNFEVTCNWPKLKVVLNGVLIHDIDMEKDKTLRYRLRSGYIALENMCNNVGLYKNVEIKTLPGKVKWTQMFNGKNSLAVTGKSQWNYDATTRTFIAEGNNSIAYTKLQFSAPYELQVWVKCIVANENGGIIFNSPGGKKHSGLEVQCFNVPGATNPTGSIYGRAPAKRVDVRDGEWYLIQMFNYGEKVIVYVNGDRISEANKLPAPYKGFIGFQQHTPNGKIAYREAKIRKIVKKNW